MLLRMWELLYSPFVLLLISSKSLNSNNSESRENVSLTVFPPTSENKDARLPHLSCNKTSLFYEHINSSIRGCYKEAEKGPCEENMKLYAITGTRNGECDCDSLSNRILVHHNETNRCYPIYQQGYCEPGQWIVITRESFPEAVCERNYCYEEAQRTPNMRGKDVAPLSNGTCVEVGSECWCGETNAKHVISFESNNIFARCCPPKIVRSPGNSIRAISPGNIRCSKGMYRNIMGTCQEPVDWFD